MLVLFWVTILFSVTGGNVIEANYTTDANKDTTPAKVCNCSTNPDLLETLLCFVKEKHQVIIAFLTGSFLTAIICCLATKCCRKKQKRSENMVETLDMVTTEAVPLTDAAQSAENDLKAAEGGADGQPEEVEYSDIDFSRWKRTSSAGAEETQKTPESEYAELKKDEKVEKQEDSGGEDGEMLEGNEEELGMMGEDEETKQGTLGEEEGEAVGVSSDVNETMDEI